MLLREVQEREGRFYSFLSTCYWYQCLFYLFLLHFLSVIECWSEEEEEEEDYDNSVFTLPSYIGLDFLFYY